MTKKKTTQRVWTLSGTRTVKGTLEPLLVDGKQPTYIRTEWINRKPVEQPPVSVFLFHAGRLWWLHYGEGCGIGDNTGAFKSKKDAVAWWTHGGR